ncbi:MAG: glycosyltransferase family 39 protein [Chloroflexi bacterium]|nr:glycosyltransferase family 39 protein [Chloroflexota bacterium]
MPIIRAIQQLSNFTRRHLLGTILVIALVLRLALVIYVVPYPERYIWADAIGYNQIAINLLSGHGFSQSLAAPFIPDNMRTPIYPLTIAICYALFGYAPGIVLVLEALMGLLTVLAAYYIGSIAIDRSAGLLAAALLAISPMTIIYSAELWSDTEFTFLLTLCVLLAMIMLVRCQLRWVILGSLAAGIATLTHPRSLFLPLFFAAALLVIHLVKQTRTKTVIAQVALYIIIYSLVCSSWVMRNVIVFGVPNLTSISAVNVLDYAAALTEASLSGEDQWAIADRYHAELNVANPQPMNEAQFADLALQYGIKKIVQNPLAFAKVQLVGMAKTLLPAPFTVSVLLTGHEWNPDLRRGAFGLFITKTDNGYEPVLQVAQEVPIAVLILLAFESVYLIGVYVLSACSLIAPRRILAWSLFFGAIILYLAFVAGPAGVPRFRVAMMPFLCVLAAQGFRTARQMYSRVRARSLPRTGYS